ncbi:MAG: MFS transporter [Methanosarcina sp.]
MLVASFFVGFTASVTQQIVPAAASLASGSRRGSVVGSVMSGLLSGVLLSRLLAGFIAAHYGWSSMFWFAIPLVLTGGAAMALLLPFCRPTASMKYKVLLGSLLHLWRNEPRLRRAALVQGPLFAIFSAFWTVLALHLEQPSISTPMQQDFLASLGLSECLLLQYLGVWSIKRAQPRLFPQVPLPL